MFKKNDPLVEVTKQIMKENETRRQVESLVNESLGIESRKALPHEYHADYDDLLKESIDVALKEGIEALDEVSLKKAIGAYRRASEKEHWNRNDYEGNDKAANSYRKQKNKFKSYIGKKGGDKAVSQAEKGATQDIEGKKYNNYRDDTISTRKEVLDKEKKSGRWGVFSKGPKKGHLKQAGEHKKYMQVTHDSVMRDAKKKVNLPESEQLDEEFKHVKVAKKGDVEKAYRLDRGDRRIDIRKHKDGSWVADSNFGHNESDGNDYHSSEKDVKRVSTLARRAIKSVMKGARDQRDAIKDELDESTQVNEGIIKKIMNELPSRKKKIEDLNRRAMQKPTVKGWANAQKRVNAAVKEENLQEFSKNTLKLYEDTSIESILDEIRTNLQHALMEAQNEGQEAFDQFVDSLTEDQKDILGF